MTAETVLETLGRTPSGRFKVKVFEWYYGCVRCQRVHYECQKLYERHILRQEKHGLHSGYHYHYVA